MEKAVNHSIKICKNEIKNRITLKIKTGYYLQLLTPVNVFNNSCQPNSRVLHTFIPNKLFRQLLDISPENFIFLKTFDSEDSYLEVWLTNQNSNPLGIEDKIYITLVIN